jgi:lysozyme
MFDFIIVDFIKKVEGLRLKPYKDKFDNLTIGYGRNLDDRGITREEAEILLFTDLAIAEYELKGIFSDYDSYPGEVKLVLVSMIYNLGKNRFLTFKKFIKAIKKNDYKKAIFELYNSKRAKQLPNRTNLEAKYLKKIIKE